MHEKRKSLMRHSFHSSSPKVSPCNTTPLCNVKLDLRDDYLHDGETILLSCVMRDVQESRIMRTAITSIVQ